MHLDDTRLQGATSVILDVFIQDDRLIAVNATQGGLTGLVFNTAGLTCYYHRDADAASTAVTLATMTVGTFTSSGFKEIDATNMPGWYQLCLPNTAFAAGKSVSIHLKGAANMADKPIIVRLVKYDPDDAVRLGLTALPNAAAEAAGGLYTRGSGAGQINQPGNGVIDINLKQILGTVLTETAGLLAGGFKKFFNVATPTGTLNSIPDAVPGAVGALITGDSTNSGKFQSGIKKNTARTNFPFIMQDSSGNLLTGLTVTAQRRIDNGSFGACSNSPTEVANGWYTIDLSAADLNGNTVAFRFVATGARDSTITVIPVP